MKETKTAGIVAPAWLQEPLAVLLEAARQVTVWASSITAEELLAAPAVRPPDLTLMYVPDRETVGQVEVLKAAWPATDCIALVQYPRDQGAASEAGADVVLLEGLVAGRLLETIDRLCEAPALDPAGAGAGGTEGEGM